MSGPLYVAVLLGFGSGCGAEVPYSVPRTLAGATQRGPFVPPGSYEAYVRGELLLAEGRPREAVAQLELAATAPDEDAYLLSRLAFAQLRAGDARAASATLRHASQLDRCSEAVWLTRGLVAEETGDLPAAETAYEKATGCAPRSPLGSLELARVLEQRGDHARALDVLARASEQPDAAVAEQALERSLGRAAPASLEHALARLAERRTPPSEALEHAIRLALDHRLPRLALRLREQHLPTLPPALEADLLQANFRRAELAALLARTDAHDLGGSARTAELALYAGAYERAELEASSALAEKRSDPLLALRARALLALGRPREALADARAIEALPIKRALLLDLLAESGTPALAAELRSVP